MGGYYKITIDQLDGTTFDTGYVAKATRPSPARQATPGARSTIDSRGTKSQSWPADGQRPLLVTRLGVTIWSSRVLDPRTDGHGSGAGRFSAAIAVPAFRGIDVAPHLSNIVNTMVGDSVVRSVRGSQRPSVPVSVCRSSDGKDLRRRRVATMMRAIIIYAYDDLASDGPNQCLRCDQCIRTSC